MDLFLEYFFDIILYMNIPILYINLDRSENRNIRMVEELNKINANYYRIQGVDSQNISKNALKEGECQDFKYFIKSNIEFKPRSKEIAIILSHLKALNEIVKNNFEIAIIMEDDTSFQYIQNWNEKISEIISLAPDDWKIIKMHTSTPSEIESNINFCKKGINYIPLNAKAIQSAGCYIIKKETAIEILDKYNINNIYTFPHKNEYCVCECIIFSVSNIYMYTIPYICAIDNNLTCSGSHNPADKKCNHIIHSYWKEFNKNNNNNKDINKDIKNNHVKYIKEEKIRFKSIKKMLIEKKNK
jgi:GR25 family glycosyltransferase involved in LPS biosynthesis